MMPLRERPPCIVLNVGMRGRLWAAVRCKWCDLFGLHNGCISCREVCEVLRRIVAEREFRRRRDLASLYSVDRQKLLEWMLDYQARGK